VFRFKVNLTKSCEAIMLAKRQNAVSNGYKVNFAPHPSCLFWCLLIIAKLSMVEVAYAQCSLLDPCHKFELQVGQVGDSSGNESGMKVLADATLLQMTFSAEAKYIGSTESSWEESAQGIVDFARVPLGQNSKSHSFELQRTAQFKWRHRGSLRSCQGEAQGIATANTGKILIEGTNRPGEYTLTSILHSDTSDIPFVLYRCPNGSSFQWRPAILSSPVDIEFERFVMSAEGTITGHSENIREGYKEEKISWTVSPKNRK
jgi:hypothetical protein